MNKKRYFKMPVYVLFFVFVFGGQVLAQEEEEPIQMRPNPLEKVAGQEAAQPQGWIIKEVNEINTGNGPGGERPVVSEQQMRPATPAQQMRPRAPEQQMRPRAPEQQIRPRTPAQQMRPAAPVQQIRPAAPAQQMRPAAPARQMRPADPRR
ncbi:MAG: hypothetical protein R6V39_04225 [Desulfovibrionales bacterium]